MAYSSSSSMQDLFYMDNAPVASTSTSTAPTRFTVDYAPRPSPIHHWLAAHRPYLPHDEPSSSCSTPRSAFSDDEESEDEQEQEQDEESEDESEEEDEREMIFLRPRRHGSASPFARSSSDLASRRQQQLQQQQAAIVAPRKLRSTPVLASPKRNSPRMIAALALYRPRPAQPIVNKVQANGTSSFEAAPCTSHWSSDEEDSEDEQSQLPRGRPYRRSTLRPEDDEALWTVAPHELVLEEDDDDDEEEMPGLCGGGGCEASSSTRSMPIPISPSPLRHPYFDPSRDDVSIVLSTTEHPLSPSSPPHDAKAARQVFQKGQSFYNGWLREYVAAHH